MNHVDVFSLDLLDVHMILGVARLCYCSDHIIGELLVPVDSKPLVDGARCSSRAFWSSRWLDVVQTGGVANAHRWHFRGVGAVIVRLLVRR